MTVQDLRDKGLIIFETISGSRSYGLHTEQSDTDIRGVYCAPMDDVMSGDYKMQVADDKNDIVFYEVKKFLELLTVQNPNMLELLYTPSDCIIYKHPVIDIIFSQREKFLTTVCELSFGGYAVAQIKKAKGLNKRINNPQMVIRKTVLDFCYFLSDGISMDAALYLNKHGLDQKYVGLVYVEHVRYTYAAYNDSHSIDVENGVIDRMYAPYRGIVSNTLTSNDITISPKRKGEVPFCYMFFNKDAYQTHCRLFLEYSVWVKNRNPARYEVNTTNGCDYDVKNMMHCIRLCRMGREIALEKKIHVRRADRDYLMLIRNGKVKYEDLLKEANDIILSLKGLYAESGLPEEVPHDLVRNLIISVRKVIYEK